MAELKPCPFCGRIPMVEDCGDNRFFVRCKCGIAQDKLYGQRCDAVRRWNTRKQSADAVEVVRCKDCKYASPNGIYGCRLERFSAHDKSERLFAEDYCSLAERREE